METSVLITLIILAAVLLGVVGLLLVSGRRLTRKQTRRLYPETRDADDLPPGAAEDAEGDTLVADRPDTATAEPTEVPQLEVDAPAPAVEAPEPVATRLARLRARLVKSNNVFGKSLLALLSQDQIDEDVWDEIEETLLMADLGTASTVALVDTLRERVTVEGSKDPERVRAMLHEELVKLIDPTFDRRLTVTADGRPAVVLVVGVNGVGKTTTVGKLARVLVAEDKDVILGAADTFRAAAAEQLTTWGALSLIHI